jgi:hypothetical protein
MGLGLAGEVDELTEGRATTDTFEVATATATRPKGLSERAFSAHLGL